MKGWWPSPSGQLSDPRCARLTLLGRGVLWSLCDAADGRGAVDLGALTPDAALLALSGRTPEPDVVAGWAEVEGAGLAYVEEGRIVLDLPTFDLPTFDRAAIVHPEREVAAGAINRRTAAKRLSGRWSRLKLTTAEARLTWCASAEGQKVCAELGLNDAAARDLATGAGQRRGVFGRDKDPRTRGAKPGSSTLPERLQHDPPNGASTGSSAGAVHGASSGASPGFPPAPPSGERNTEKEAENAREAPAPAAVPASGSSAGTVNGSSSGASQLPRCPTIEPARTPLPAVEAREVFAHLRGGTKLGGAGLALSATKDHERELNERLRGFEGDAAPWTVASVKRFAAHIGAGHLREGWRPTLSALRGKDGSWTTLLSLHDEAQGCAACAPTRPRTPPTASPTLTPEELAAKARALLQRAPAAQETTHG